MTGSAPDSARTDDTRTVAIGSAAGSRSDARGSATTGPRPLDEVIDDHEAPRGRYVVIEPIGAGAMGKVWRAYDPKLRREVALKQLRGDVLRDEAHLRLVREAQAMAQLNHANVVAVYDVETADEGHGVLIAMEYVPGRTLRRFVLDDRPPWTSIVAVFVQAGQGLLAAHRVGLVHRDFKPTNVLVTPEGVAKVTDFGLAKGIRAPDSLPGDASTESGVAYGNRDDLDELGSPLTQADVVMGTPRYMAPEQHAGAPAGPAADQYAFCVALWEALCEQAPFSGKSLAKAKFDGPPAWPRGTSVPRPIVDAIRRGLSVAPEARWPAMADLLSALAYDPSRRRRRLLSLGAGVVAIGIVVGGVAIEQARRSERCGGGPAQIEPLWNDEVRATVVAAIAGTGLAYADDTGARVTEHVDRYTTAWLEQHREACEATSIRQEQSAAALDLRMACLQRARTELGATVDLLAHPDAKVVEKSIELVEALPRIARCEDVDALQSQAPPPDDPETAARVDAEREKLAQASAQNRVGRYPEALALAEAVVQEAEAIEYEPLVVEARAAVGAYLDALGRYADSEEAYHEALRRALAAGARERAASVASSLVQVVGHRLHRWEEARWLGTLAISLARAEGAGTELEAAALHAMASALMSAGKREETREHLLQALEIRERLFGRADTRVALSLHGLGLNAVELGDYDAAETYLLEALEIRKQVLGPDHPSIGYTLNGLSNLYRIAGRLDEALETADRALEVRKVALGPDHPEIASTHNNIALVHYMRGDFERAAEVNREALRIREQAHGPEHPDVADSYNNIGAALNALGRYEEAERHHARALEIREKVLGPDHAAVAMSLTNLGVAVRHLGRLQEAEDIARRALAINEARLGPEHSEVANSLDNLGNALVERKKYDEARAQYERSLKVREKSLGPDHAEVGRSCSNLGSVLETMGRLDEAETHLRRAIEVWEHARGPEYADLGFAWQSLGDVMHARGRTADAEDAYRRALKIRETALAPDHPLVAVCLTDLGRLAAERGELQTARTDLARALQIRDDKGEPAELRAETGFALADVTWRIGRDRTAARELAERALAVARSDDDVDPELEQSIARWLAER